MIDDNNGAPFTEDTQRDYVRHVRTFAAFLGRSPDMATREDLRRFQLHMARQEIGDRDLPHLGARRPRRALRGLRPHARRLQLLPQPTLPKVSGRSRPAVARRT